MTITGLDPDALAPVLAYAAEHADALDRNEMQGREILPRLAAAGALDLGSPANRDGGLVAMAEAMQALARECVTSAFTTWAHRMTLEYLVTADTEWSRTAAAGLRSGTVPGVTGMASAFRELAGCGSLDLSATPTEDGGYLISGPIRWASNLYPDALVVSAARTERGERIIFATPWTPPGSPRAARSPCSA